MLEVELIKQFFPIRDNLTIFDIGACDFKDSIRFKEHFPSATVWAFEPDIDNINNHRHTADSLGIYVVPVAISDVNSEIVFYPSETLNGKEWKFSGSVKKPITIDGTSEGINHKGLHYNLNGYVVQSVRLDTFCELNSISQIDYLHVDVQGAEYDVMNSLNTLRPKIIFAETCEFTTYETNMTTRTFDDFMYSLGYKLHMRLEYDSVYLHESL